MIIVFHSFMLDHVSTQREEHNQSPTEVLSGTFSNCDIE